MLKKSILICIKICISVSLIYLLLHRKDMSLGEIANQFRTTSVKWIVIGILLFTMSNVLGSFQWFLLLRARGIELPFKKAIAFYYVGLFFNNFLLGYIAGDAFRIYDISKSGGKGTDAVSTVFLDRFIGFVVLTSLALIAGLVWLRHITSSTVLLTLSFILVSWLLVIFILFNEKLARKLKHGLQLFLPEKILIKLKESYQSVNAFRHQKKLLLITVLTSIFIQGLRILVHYAAARATHANHIELYYFFVFIPIVALAVSFPISIGGFGVREQTAVNLFCLPGVGGIPKGVTAMEFMAYLIGVVSTLVGGVVFILRKKHRLRERSDIGDSVATPEIAK